MLSPAFESAPLWLQISLSTSSSPPAARCSGSSVLPSQPVFPRLSWTPNWFMKALWTILQAKSSYSRLQGSSRMCGQYVLMELTESEGLMQHYSQWSSPSDLSEQADHCSLSRSVWVSPAEDERKKYRRRWRQNSWLMLMQLLSLIQIMWWSSRALCVLGWNLN